jgi:hypothetical protein
MGSPEYLPIVQIRPNPLHPATKKALQTRMADLEAVCSEASVATPQKDNNAFARGHPS